MPQPARRGSAFELEKTLPYLLNRAGVRIGASFSTRIGEQSLTLPEWRILASLLGREAQSVSEIAAHTSAELSRASRLVASLTRRRLLRREADRADRRAWRVSLTAEGRALAEAIVPLAVRYERVALQGMNSTEIATLKRLLVRVFDNMGVLESPAMRRPALPARGSAAPRKPRGST